MERDCFELCSGLAPAAIALIVTASKSRVLRGDEVCTSSPVEVCQKGSSAWTWINNVIQALSLKSFSLV